MLESCDATEQPTFCAMDRVLAARKVEYKATGVGDDQDRRRRRLLDRARQKRSDRCARLIESSLAAPADASFDAEVRGVELTGPEPAVLPPAAPASASAFRVPARVAAASRPHANALQIPTWMVGRVPVDLAYEDSSAVAASLDAGSRGWFVLPRPSGIQCLVVASRDGTIARDEGGHLMVRFRSFLQPGKGAGGSSRLRGASSSGSSSGGGVTVLDCIFEEASHAFHVVDVLVWEGTPCHEWPFEMRRFWLQSNLPALGADRVVVPSGWRRALVCGGKGCGSRRGSSGDSALPSASLFAPAASSTGSSGAGLNMATDAADGRGPPTFVSSAAVAAAVGSGSSSAPSAAGGTASGPINEYAFALLPHHECSMAGLRAAYETASLAVPDAAGGRYSSAAAAAARAVTAEQATVAPKSYVSQYKLPFNGCAVKGTGLQAAGIGRQRYAALRHLQPRPKPRYCCKCGSVAVEARDSICT